MPSENYGGMFINNETNIEEDVTHRIRVRQIDVGCPFLKGLHNN